ncbi:hypothetical protein [Saccharibacillus alkalitolerans]|uniref:MORN repeat-containing protein n=1 Tax=Saccharibacillus alkalitolerans TaxID=2705290 RepID=A0ABX0F3Y4_9BACL|nr:hypothetical protein [Saccharibacillus alkalitolerans]NGZ75145.1 hypothetical protein [Saccharibacillus alkalitolerans]
MELYFCGQKRPFGKGVIRQIGGNRKGSIDYKGEGENGLYVLDGEDYVLYRGCLERSPNKWTVRDAREEIVGRLSREKNGTETYFGYDAGQRGYYRIESDIGGYRIKGTNKEAAFVDMKKHWLKSGEYCLQTEDGMESAVGEYEWVAVMQGIEVLRGQRPFWQKAIAKVISGTFF